MIDAPKLAVVAPAPDAPRTRAWASPWLAGVALFALLALHDSGVLRVFPPGDLGPRFVAIAIGLGWLAITARYRRSAPPVADAVAGRPAATWESPHASTIGALVLLVALLLRALDAEPDAPISLSAAFLAVASTRIAIEVRARATAGLPASGIGRHALLPGALALALAMLAILPALVPGVTGWGAPVVAADVAVALALTALVAAHARGPAPPLVPLAVAPTDQGER